MRVKDVINILHDGSEAVIYNSTWDELARYNGNSATNKCFTILQNRKVALLIPRTDGALAIEIED